MSREARSMARQRAHCSTEPVPLRTQLLSSSVSCSEGGMGVHKVTSSPASIRIVASSLISTMRHQHSLSSENSLSCNPNVWLLMSLHSACDKQCC